MDTYQVGVVFDPSSPEDFTKNENFMFTESERVQQMLLDLLKTAMEVFSFERDGEKPEKIFNENLTSATP